jgi:hypothetical protein
MKLRFLFLVLFSLCATALHAQGFWVPIQYLQEGTIAGVTNAVIIPPSPVLAFCNAPANAVPCTNKAATYTDSTLGTLCSTSTQFVLNGTNACVGFLNPQNLGGVWVAAGQYAYTVSVGGANFGPFFITAGGSGGGGGGGPTLQTNGVPNASQSLLNLKSGTGIVITSDGAGGVTVSSSITPTAPGGASNSLQYNCSGSFCGTPGIVTPDGGNSLDIKGPIPWIDATQYGMRTFPNPPNIITVSTSASSPTVSTTGVSDFIKNDGIVIPQAGPATAQSTPAAPTLQMIGASGAQTVNYRCVAVDRQWGLTAASPATAITNVPTVFGAPAAVISSIVRSANVVTVTTGSAMPFSSGSFHARIGNVTGGTTQFSGLQVVTVMSGTTLTYSQTGANESGTVGATSFVRFDNAFFVTTAQATTGSNQVVLTTDVPHNILWNNSGLNPDEVFTDGIQFTAANPQGYAIGPFPVGGIGASTITINTSYTSPITTTGVANFNYSTSQSGVNVMTVTVFPKVIVTCPAISGTTVYYAIYADYGSGSAPIGFTPWLHNKFEDYGPAFTKSGFTPPPAMNLPATFPVAAQNQVFSGQIASIFGTTLTLTGNVPTAVSAVTAYHDDGVPFQNAIAASCSSIGGNTFDSVYLPPGIAFGYYFFHAPVDLSATCNRTNILDGGAIYANGTIYDDSAGELVWRRPQDLSGFNSISTGAPNKGQILLFGLASPEMVTPPAGSSSIVGMQFNVLSNSQVGLLVQNNNVHLEDNTFETVGANNLSAIPFEMGGNVGFEFKMTTTAWSGDVNTQYPVTAGGDPPVGDIAYWPVPVFDFFGPNSMADTIIVDGINYGNLRGFRLNNMYGLVQSSPMVIMSDIRTYQSPYNPLLKIVGNFGLPRVSITRAISDSIQQPITTCIRSDNGSCGNFYSDDVVSSDGSANFPVFTGPPWGVALQYSSPGSGLAQNTNECTYLFSPSSFNCTLPIIGATFAGGTFTGTSFSAGSMPPTAVCGTATGALCLGESSTGCTPTAGQACIRADSTSNEFLATINGTPEAPLVQTTGTSVDLTGQTAAIGATNIVASAPRNAIYRICFSSNITTAGSVSSTLGGTNGFQVIYTSPTDLSSNTTVPNAAWSSTANTTATAVGGCVSVYALASTAIQYSFGYTANAAASMAYEIHVRAEDGLN